MEVVLYLHNVNMTELLNNEYCFFDIVHNYRAKCELNIFTLFKLDINSGLGDDLFYEVGTEFEYTLNDKQLIKFIEKHYKEDKL